MRVSIVQCAVFAASISIPSIGVADDWLATKVRGQVMQAVNGNTLPPAENELMQQLAQRLALVDRVYTSTGLDLVERDNLLRSFDEDTLRFEMQLIANEVFWRLRDLSRDLALRISNTPGIALERYLPLIQLLNGTQGVPAAKS